MYEQWTLPRGAVRAVLSGALAALLVSCGGSPGFTSSSFARRCATPRPGIDQQGSFSDEKTWLRLWTNELYLWYREVPSSDPSAYATPQDYFKVLKTTALTPSGNPKDRFHFIIPTAQWIALSQSGVQAGYGVEWAVIAPSPPRDVRAAFTEPNSPSPATSAPANISRGAKVLNVDGADVGTGPASTLNAGLFPANANETHTFTVLDVGATTSRTFPMTSANVTTTPVQNVGIVGSGSVGYMLFNDHIATAQDGLIAAVNKLKSLAAKELVVDIRYNGGGYLDIASELAFMIAGPATTAGKTFEKLTFNDKYPTTNPVTGAPIVPVGFISVAENFSTASGQPLPYLGLPRVFVLTGPGTCSASESIINSLRGIDVQVIQVGSTTCGKPYGFYPADNCGSTYFSIQFQGVNAKGFGDYSDGFIPGGTVPAGVPGCQVADDFTHALGDPAEARLAAALGYAAGQACPPPTFALSSPRTALSAAAPGEELAVKSPWRENRIVRR
jgi:carboxyl-terminal processing protease